MSNSSLRKTLMRMLAAKELRLDGHGRHPLSDGGRVHVAAEADALKEVLSRLDLFDQARLDNIREKIRLDWAESDAERGAP